MPTTNPVPSTDPSDLLFNAGKLDEVVSGASTYYTDRLGVNRRTVEGISASADVVLAGIGYAPPVTYAAGISLTLTTQTVEYAGEVYAPKLANLPFTTSGTFETAKFRLIQGVASAELPALVGQDLQDYAALRAYTGLAKRIYITGLLVTKKPAGIAGVFQHDPTDTTSADNGGTIIVDASGRRWKRDHSTGWVNVQWFGATGKGVVDDAPAIQLAINYLGSIGGGILFFPNGAYFVNQQINITNPRINFRGTGRRGVYPGVYVPDEYGISTIFAKPTHPGPNMFRFFSNTINALAGFSAEDIAFTMQASAPVATIDCFGWDMGHFQYDFLFNRVSIHYFNAPFNVYKTGALTDQQAALRIRDSNINQNNWIAKTTGTNTTWNGFELTGCNAGQNIMGGVDIKATGAVIHNNILEGQPNPIKLTGINSPFSIKLNYFELTSGLANIYIASSRGAGEIGPNFHFNNASLKVTHRVLLENAAFVNCVDPYWSDRTYRCYPLPKIRAGTDIHGMGDNSGVYTSTRKFLRVDDPETVAGVAEISANVTTAARSGRREISPIDRLPMSCLAFSSGGTAGTNVATVSLPGTTVAAGEWIVLTWMCKYDQPFDSGYNPYVSWVAGVADGTQDTVLDYLQQCSNVGEFYVFTAAYRCATPITSATVQMNFYPYGVSNPNAGRTAAISGFTRSIVQTVEQIKPFVSPRALRYASAAPTLGTWFAGDIIYNSNPTASGFIGWICTASGTPGTWKTFGAISA